MSQEPMRFEWRAPGPVSAAFMQSRADVALINGPVGSAKTTTTLMKLIRTSQAQQPSKNYMALGPGNRRMPTRQARWAVVRDTYRQLWRTTLPSWWSRIPRTVGHFTGAEGAPAVHMVTFALADGTLLELQIDFVAIGDQSAQDVLRGYEVTGFYLNEMDLLSAEVFDYARTRTGRFPPMDEGGPTWHGIFGDLNAPELNNWCYRRFWNRSADSLAADGIALFVQPSGFSPQAENLANLTANYYQNMARGAPDWLVTRMIKNTPGYSRAGKPVYPEFNDQLHVAAANLAPVRGIPLSIGLDAGGHPAAVFGQRLPSGKWLILGELVGEAGTGARRFGAMLARYLHDEFPEWQAIEAWADPSAAYGADAAAGEATWIDIVAAVAGIRVRPAPTNKPIPRWEAVRLPLTRLIDGEPGLILSPRCGILRAGFNSDYHFRKMHVAEERYAEEAEKNSASHPHDALQYVLSGGGEDMEIRARGADQRRQASRLPVQAPSWDPYTGAAV